MCSAAVLVLLLAVAAAVTVSGVPIGSDGDAHLQFFVVPRKSLSPPTGSLDEIDRALDIRGEYMGLVCVVASQAAMGESHTPLGRYVPTEILFFLSAFDLVDHMVDAVNHPDVRGRAMPVNNNKDISNHNVVLAALPADADVAQLQSILGDRIESIRLPARRVFTPVQPKHTINGTRSEIVQSLVDAVSQARLRSNVETLSDFATRYSLSEEVRDAEAYIANRFSSIGLPTRTEFFRNQYGYNVIAEKQGTLYPNSYVVIGAHFDSIPSSGAAPGADDNGSGTSAVLELADVIQSSGLSFAYSIRFAAWCGEEQGLIGSAFHASAARDNNTDIIAYLNADMLGYTIPDTDITLGMKSQSSTAWLNELAISLTHEYVPDLATGYSSSCCSDWISFYNEGYASVGYFENTYAASNYPCYHRSCDLPAEINFLQVELEAKSFLAGLATLADPIA